MTNTITEPNYDFSIEELRKALSESDGRCIYCRKTTLTVREAKAQNRNRDYYTIEHFTPKRFGYCCNACNASRKPPLQKWFKTDYCLTRNINEKTVAEVVREWVRIEGEMVQNHGGWNYYTVDLIIPPCAPSPPQLAFSF